MVESALALSTDSRAGGMTEIERIADELRRGYDGDPWHGPPLLKVLAGVSADQAARHPLPGAHSIWETVRHLTAWIGEIARRLSGEPPGDPPEGDWPPVMDASAESWARARADLARAHEALLQQLAGLGEEGLWEVVGTGSRDRALGTGTTWYVMLHGLAQHHAYHAAQISTLRRVLAACS